jgi:protein-S-isoprenylcysteine O-methyltransferase Ste14
MKIIGKTTINPLLFYSGKICGYITWILLALNLSGVSLIGGLQDGNLKIASLVFLCIGLIFTALSLVNLGRSTRLGLPSEDTDLKTEGIYRLSRNPMYLGFNLFTLASIAYSINIITAVMGLYSIIVYHFIILGEEAFLEKRFGNDYMKYKGRVRRYI